MFVPVQSSVPFAVPSKMGNLQQHSSPRGDLELLSLNHIEFGKPLSSWQHTLLSCPVSLSFVEHTSGTILQTVTLFKESQRTNLACRPPLLKFLLAILQVNL